MIIIVVKSYKILDVIYRTMVLINIKFSEALF